MFLLTKHAISDSLTSFKYIETILKHLHDKLSLNCHAMISNHLLVLRLSLNLNYRRPGTTLKHLHDKLLSLIGTLS